MRPPPAAFVWTSANGSGGSPEARTNVRVWFRDEARFGRQGTRTAVWAITGSRPTVVCRNGRTSIWVVAAIEPTAGWSSTMPLRDVNTATMRAFLDATASTLHRHEQAVMFLDGSGWHGAHTLRWPRWTTPSFLPPYSPALLTHETWIHRGDASSPSRCDGRPWIVSGNVRERGRTFAAPAPRAPPEHSHVRRWAGARRGRIRSHRTLRRKDIRPICATRWITPEDCVGFV